MICKDFLNGYNPELIRVRVRVRVTGLGFGTEVVGNNTTIGWANINTLRKIHYRLRVFLHG
jgi:hypothetical protein